MHTETFIEEDLYEHSDEMEEEEDEEGAGEMSGYANTPARVRAATVMQPMKRTEDKETMAFIGYVLQKKNTQSQRLSRIDSRTFVSAGGIIPSKS